MLASYYFSLIRHQVIGEDWREEAASGLTLTFAMFGFCSVILPLSFYVGIGHLGFVWEVRCFRRAKYMCMCVYIYIYMYISMGYHPSMDLRFFNGDRCIP